MKKKKRQGKAAGVMVVVKEREQGAQMAVDSRGVDKAVCWSPRGQYGNGIKNSWPIFGIFFLPFAETEKRNFANVGRWQAACCHFLLSCYISFDMLVAM
jgi:hypothetical protein